MAVRLAWPEKNSLVKKSIYKFCFREHPGEIKGQFPGVLFEN